MSKQKRSRDLPPGEAEAPPDGSTLDERLFLRERHTFLEQLRRSERENQSLRRRVSALEEERDVLLRRLRRIQAFLPARGHATLKAAHDTVTRARQTLRDQARGVKERVRPLFDTLKRAEQRMTGPLDGALDHPTRAQHVGTTLLVAGWAASPTTRVQSVEAWLDEHRLGLVPWGNPRPDVLAARPWVSRDADCGFHAAFGINPNWVPGGLYTLRVLIRDDQGNEKQLTRPVRLTAEPNAYPTMGAAYYQEWIARNEPDATALLAQRQLQAQLAYRPLLSLLTPVYNTPEDVLRETIRSVREQTYPNWELWLVDGHSSAPHVARVLEELSALEPRIHVKRLPENLGISGNTNAALALARGEFIALLDHDDTLAPFALYEVARRLDARPGTDMLYSDEDRVDMDGSRHSAFFKPDWSPDLLQSFMYVGHLSVYRRALVQELGGFRSEFDLSQDYDLALRVSERTRAIEHIPQVLYHWRTLPGSGAAGGKPHARRTNVAALDSAVRRRGYDAETLAEPAANRVKFKPPPDAFVSLIVPSDNAQHLRACIEGVLGTTDWSRYELVIVTNSGLVPGIHAQYAHEPRLRTVTYDGPFNFSLKCNLGVAEAKGDFVLFLNDDVRPLEPDWLGCMLGSFQQEDVGAVAPKLVYPNNTLQHAGMVTGVRQFVGTAFHTLPRDTLLHFHFAQSTRTVALLSAACLLMRKKVFEDVGGFDAVNTPIMHSDVDLCFKIREAGLRLVYTPFTALEHEGHVSLAALERKGHVQHSRKAEVYLLKRWSAWCAYDPYFPDHLREFLYFDSLTAYRLYGGARAERRASRGDVLLASHDLSQSGAPIILQSLAAQLNQDYFVTVLSPTDGPLREAYTARGIPVLVDPLSAEEPERLEKLIADFDLVVANTLMHWRLVLTAKRLGKPVVWFIHEAELGVKLASEQPDMARALALADEVVFPGEMVARLYRDFQGTGHHRALLYGLPTHAPQRRVLPRTNSRVRVIQIGSIEPRKGQDVLIQALRELGAEAAGFEVFFVGRVLIRDYALAQYDATADLPNVFWLGEVPATEVLDYLVAADVLVCTSRDECLPLVVVDALAQRRPVIVTDVGLLPEVIEEGRNGFLVRSEDAAGVARALLRLKDAAERERLAQAGRATYEERLGHERYGRAVSGLIDGLLTPLRS